MSALLRSLCGSARLAECAKNEPAGIDSAPTLTMRAIEESANEPVRAILREKFNEEADRAYHASRTPEGEESRLWKLIVAQQHIMDREAWQ